MELLLSLVRDCPIKKTRWKYDPAGEARAAGSFAGLVNQGATCYMNSLLQQLFVMPHFVDQVLAAWASLPDRLRLDDKSVLYQFCRLMCHLKVRTRRTTSFGSPRA